MVGNRDRKLWAVAGLLFLVAIGLATLRAGLLTEFAGVRLSARWVMADFFSGAYYPVRAVLAGENPHDRARFLSLYPVGDSYAPFLPINLVVHFPFALFSPRTAGILYFGFTLAVTALLARLALRQNTLSTRAPAVLFVTALVLLSRPGHWNLVLGQRAALLTAATYAALIYAKQRPGLSGLALSLSMLKPTHGGPLAILMFARGERKAALIGGGDRRGRQRAAGSHARGAPWRDSKVHTGPPDKLSQLATRGA